VLWLSFQITICSLDFACHSSSVQAGQDYALLVCANHLVLTRL
jgi:hypothetical protein